MTNQQGDTERGGGLMPETPDEDYALRYVYEAMKYKPGASHREIRRESVGG